MAKEAIIKVKTAEDESTQRIKKAMEDAKLALRAAETDGQMKQTEIVKQTKKEAEKLREQAEQQARKECEPLIVSGEEELKKIQNPDPNKRNQVIGLVVERIVNSHGYR